MKQLIARYDSEWRARLAAIARTIPATGAPAYVYAVSAVKILPPVRPSVQLNAGGNYVEHEQGIATNQARGAGAARGGARRAEVQRRAEAGRRLRQRSRRRGSGSARRAIRATTRTCS